MKSLKRKHRKGQTMVEFVFVFIMFFALLLLTFNAVVGFVVQEYFSYVAFMTARAYQAAEVNPQAQTRNAIETFKRFFPQAAINDGGGESTMRMPIKFKYFGGERPIAMLTEVRIPTPDSQFRYGTGAMNPQDNTYIGVKFEVPFFQIPFLNTSETGGALERVELEARSFLGREVTQEECRKFFEVFLKAYQNNIPFYDASLFPAMEDNGC